MMGIELLSTIIAGIGTVLAAIIKFYHSKLVKLEEKMSELITYKRVDELLEDQFIMCKEKIEDKYGPIRERLARLEDKLDALIARKD